MGRGINLALGTESVWSRLGSLKARREESLGTVRERVPRES